MVTLTEFHNDKETDVGIALDTLNLSPDMLWSLQAYMEVEFTMTNEISNEIKTIGGSEENQESKRLEVLYEGWLYDVTSFIPRHPGGSVINFYTKPGEDATLAIQQFHYRSMDRIIKIMKHLPKRPYSGVAVNKTDVDREERNQRLTKDFQALHKEMEVEGYFKPSYSHLILRFLEVHVLAALAVWLCLSQSTLVCMIGAAMAGIAGARSGWVMHEGGHHSLTGNPKVDRFLQSYAIGILPGFSAAWWRSQHNRHHAMPQRLKHDVDLETLPLIAFSSKVIRKPEKDVNVFIRNQSKLFMLVDGLLVFSFWRIYLCPRYAWKKRAYLDMFFIALHFVVASQIFTIPMYILASWVGGNYMILNFALSHTHLPVTEEPTHWVEYCLSHTADIEPSWWCDWFMGYLNYQIEHHLFPTMPQFRQRQIKDRVKALADKYGLPYYTMSYGEAVRKTFQNLNAVEEFSSNLKLS